MPSGELRLFTDASVMGSYTKAWDAQRQRVKIERRRVGQAMGAWIGWCNTVTTDRPTIAGQTHLGIQGTQRAEFLALDHGLHAVTTYVRLRVQQEIRPERIVVCVDNQTVAKILLGEWTASKLKPYYEAAHEHIDMLRKLGAEVYVNEVRETDPLHKHAHRMSKLAWNQLPPARSGLWTGDSEREPRDRRGTRCRSLTGLDPVSRAVPAHVKALIERAIGPVRPRAGLRRSQRRRTTRPCRGALSGRARSPLLTTVRPARGEEQGVSGFGP